MNIIKMLNKAKDKYWYYFEYGRGAGQRSATGIFTYAKPSNQIQRNHNKEALTLLEVKKSERIIEQQSIGSSYIPPHKFKPNFLDYYQEYVHANRKRDNRHLLCSLTKFKQFINKEFISPKEITENLCTRFRQYLLENLTGETPQNYYARFKWVIKAATKDKYFHENPTEEISALRNPSSKLKDNLEIDDYTTLLDAPLSNEDVKCAFLFSLYTGLRWCDVSAIRWKEIDGNVLTTRIIQEKTGLPVILTLHPLAKAILQYES